MKRILVIGPSGAGKSEFSRKLNRTLGIPIYHLDNIFWKEDKTHITREEFDIKLSEILSKDKWIIDGDYSRTYDIRMEKSDTIIFLDYPLDTCLKGVESRIGKNRPDIPWVEDEFDSEFKEWIINWYNNTLPKVNELLDKYKNSKEIIRFKNRKEANDYINNMNVVLETDRLILRKMNEDDFDSLKKVISDSENMKYYPKPYDDNGVKRWINWCIESYQKNGFGLYAVILKESNEMIGDCGISMQVIDDELKPEIGYHLRLDYHRLGLGSEMTQATKDYFFNNFNYDEVYSYMNKDNIPSYKTAEKNGMTFLHFYTDKSGSVDRVYRITRKEWKENKK